MNDWKYFDDWKPVRSENSNTNSWSVFEHWNPALFCETKGPDWRVFEKLDRAHSIIAVGQHEELIKLLSKWNRRLIRLGGDPTYFDWRNFRPLRLTREEDWSDWLSFLIEKSEGGVLSHFLFGQTDEPPIRYARPNRVLREVSHGGHRADLIVEWADGTVSNVEIKIGDRNLAKTFVTAREMRSLFRKDQNEWRNFILILQDQIPAWETLYHHVSNEPDIKMLTWEDVCIGLRRGITTNESLSWQAWCYAFLGATEQHLVKYPGYKVDACPTVCMESKIRVLSEGMKK
ncbi:hypothetical protein ACFL3Y_02115 [Pseudomonadota bacterium]